MTEEHRISRRASLKGIAATGALVGGIGLGSNPVSAGDNADNGRGTVAFEECYALAIYFNDKHVDPTGDGCLTVQIKVYNAETDQIETIQQTITSEDLWPVRNSDKYAWVFELQEFYDRSVSDEDTILSVTYDGTTVENPNDCAKTGHDPGTGEPVGHDEAAIGVHHENIDLVSVCVDPDDDLARFRIDNDNEKAIVVRYAGKDLEGTVTVEAEGSTYFDVSAPDGETTVRIYRINDKIDEERSATDTECQL